MKKKILPLLLIMLFLIPTQSLAVGEFEVIELYDPYDLITVQPYYNSALDSISLSISGTRAVKVYFASYGNDSTYTNPGTTKYRYPSDYGWHYFNGMGFNCNVYYLGELYDSADNLLVRAKIHITGLVNPKCDSGSDGVGGGTNECDSCAIFDCPGWSQYMGKLDEIKNAIPPPPNWDQVAAIFRDTIAPRIKSDMAELIGTAPNPTMPTLPSPPSAPSNPPMLPPVNDGGIQAPRGNNAPGLNDSSFTADDLKSQAPTIPVREDPTGGFNIINPIDSLPSQDEFKQNIPNEGTAPIPGKPIEHENIAPIPPEESNTAPIPSEQPVTAPKPTEPENIAPTPGSDYNSAPIPNSDSGTAPLPRNDNSQAPLPGNAGNTAPMPFNNNENKIPQPGGG